MNRRVRRMIGFLLLLAGVGLAVYNLQIIPEQQAAGSGAPTVQVPTQTGDGQLALTVLNALTIKGRAPKTGYSRTQYGDGWTNINGCDTRNIILHRDLTNVLLSSDCKVVTGTLNDPYTGKIISFTRGDQTSADVQIDHVVALSNSWQTGAQQLTAQERIALANDPLELLAVDGLTNQAKGDGDTATWLPPNKPFRCQYVARQIAVKAKYRLWVTQAESDAMRRVLTTCPGQQLPAATLGAGNN